MRFGKKGKLAPRYIVPFEILERSEKISYRLALPLKLSQVYPVFHISMLQKYVLDPIHVVPIQEVIMEGDLSYEEVFITIIDRQIRRLRNKDIIMEKVQWQKHNID